MTKSKNPNHPKKGSSIRVEPIRDLDAIERIKTMLEPHPRDYCLFVLGLNTAYRMNELLSITYGQVHDLGLGDYLNLKQSKTGEYRAVVINRASLEALGRWVSAHPDKRNSAPLFLSRKSRKALTVSACNRKIKSWAQAAGVNTPIGSHSLRKTWGYQQRVHYKEPIDLLMKAYGHKSEQETMKYLGIVRSEVMRIFENVV